MDKSEVSKLNALSEIASIDITLEFNEILQNILRITCETMNAHSGTIMLVDEVTNELRMVASYGLGQDYAERVYEAAKKAGVSITSSPSGMVLKTGKYYAVPNIYEEPRNRPWYHLSKELGFSSQIFTPMKKGLKVIGLLNIYMAKPHQFTGEEINFVAITASQAASVVQNAGLCSRLRNNLQELKQYKGHLEEKINEVYKKLYDSERYLRAIIESSLDGIAVVDEQGIIEFGNDSFFNIVGWPRDELIGQSFIKMLTDDTKEPYLKIWHMDHNSTEKIKKIDEAKIVTKDGEIRYLYKSRVETIINRARKFVFIAKDITEKKRLELSLKKSEERYRDLFENANDSLYIYDPEGYFKEVNNTALKLLGCTKDEIIGTHISNWITPESLKITQNNLKKRIDGEHVDEPMILEVICKNGEHKWMEIKRRIIKDGDRLVAVHGIGRDITEKMKLEQELRESEAKYRGLFENADDPMFTLDAAGNFVALNQIGLKILGYTEEGVIGTPIFYWLTPESIEIVKVAMKKRMQGEELNPLTVIEVICRNGEHRFFEIKSQILKDGEMITGFHGIARDITENKRLEQQLKGYHEQLEKSYEELKEAEAKYRDLFENADDPMYTLDIEGYFQTINKSGLNILGCTREEVIGSHISRWLTPESLKISMDILIKQISGESVENPVIVEVICKNGEHKWGEIRTRVISDGGRVTGIHGIARDITEKKRLEQQIEEYNEKLKQSYEELKESEAKYRELFENANDGIYTHDTEGYFLTINNAGLKIIGCTKDEVVGHHFSEWLTSESFEIAQEGLKKVISGETLKEPLIIEAIRKDGEHIWVEIQARAIMNGDRVTGIHGIVRDITEKKRLEQQLEEYHEKLKISYEELVEADRIRTEFVSNITHELLTPMTSIRGFTELICDGTTGQITDEQKKSLEIILRNSDRLTRLIKDLLDIASLERKKFGLQFGLISIDDILIKSAQDMQPQAKDKQITIIQDIKPLPKIWGDEERLTQVIINLLTNAIKFTPQKGTITITAEESIDSIKIRIIDTGIGIPSDKLSYIFNRFYQIDGSASRKYGGIGLGLSICKSIIESHYGTIWAESNGSGSSFNIVLPKLKNSKKSKAQD